MGSVIAGAWIFDPSAEDCFWLLAALCLFSIGALPSYTTLVSTTR
jgi:hypothetical protein